MAKKHFDFVIVGGGMSGCLMAKALNRLGSPSIALIEANSAVGPAAALNQYGIGSDEISFLPVDPATDRALDFVESLMGHAIARNPSEDPPLTLEKGQLQPFIGFGEKVPAEVDELMPYLNPQRIDTNPHPSRWFSLMRESMPAEVFTRSQVTKIEVDQGLAGAVV
ncbi:MAG: NAD(P)-binding protein, partial [Bdellovibrionia bacterium]